MVIINNNFSINCFPMYVLFSMVLIYLLNEGLVIFLYFITFFLSYIIKFTNFINIK